MDGSKSKRLKRIKGNKGIDEIKGNKEKRTKNNERKFNEEIKEKIERNKERNKR